MKNLTRTLILLPLAALFLAGCARSNTGTLFVSTDGGMNFVVSEKLGAEDSLSGNTVFALASTAGRAEVVFAAVRDKGLVVSRDSGASWQTTGLTTGSPRDVVIHPQALQTIFVANGQNILRTTDDGATFSTIYADPGQVNSVAIDPAAPQNVWAGTDSGSLVHSTNAGQTWEVAQSFTRPITDVFISPLGSAVVVGTNGGGLFVSADRGASFEERTPAREERKTLSLAADEIIAIAQAAGAGSPLVVATTDGLFSTRDLGQRWSQLPNPIAETEALNGLAASTGEPSVLVAVAANTIAVSKDGGLTWTTRDVPTERPLGPCTVVGNTVVAGVIGEGQGLIEQTLGR